MFFNRAAMVLLAAFVAVVPLVMWNGTLTVIGTKLFAGRAFVLLLAAIGAIGCIRSRTIAVPSPLLLALAAVFIVYTCAACLVHPYADWEIWGDLFLSILLFFEAVVVLRNPAAMRAVLITWQASVCIVCLYYLLQRAGLDFLLWRVADPDRLGSTFSNRNLMAYFLTCSFPYGIYLLVSEKKEVQWLAGVASSLCLGTIVSCHSRSSVIALVLLVPAFLLYFRMQTGNTRVKNLLFICAAAVSAALCVAGAAILLYVISLSPWELNAITHARLQLWKEALSIIKHSVWFGHGAGCFAALFPAYRSAATATIFDFANPAFNSHNEYLELLCEYGAIGLALFGALIVVGTGIRRRGFLRKSPDRGLLFFSGMSLLGCLILSFVAEASHMFVCSAFSWLSLAVFYKCNQGTLGTIRLSKWQGRLPAFGMTICLCGALAALTWYLRMFASDICTKRATSVMMTPQGRNAAMQDLGTALVFQPGNIYALYQRAFVLTETGDYQAALRDYEDIRATNPWFENVVFNMGVISYLTKDYDKAIDRLALAARQYPTFEPGILYCAQACYESGRYVDCMVWCRKLMKLDPKDKTAFGLMEHARRNVMNARNP